MEEVKNYRKILLGSDFGSDQVDSEDELDSSEVGSEKKYTRNEWGRWSNYTRNEWGRCENTLVSSVVFQQSEAGEMEATFDTSREDVVNRISQKAEEKMKKGKILGAKNYTRFECSFHNWKISGF